MKYLSFACVFLLLSLDVPAQTQAGGPEAPPTITQVGEGVAAAAPDEGYVVGGVSTTSPTANAALAENAEAMSKVLTAVKSSGIADDKIATVTFSIEEHYKRVRSADGQDHEQVRDGYTVTNKVKVTVSDLSKLGGTIDAMVAAGANSVDGIRLGNSRANQITDKARTDAVADATRKATLIARQLGYALGDVITTHEITAQPRYSSESSMASFSARTSTPIMPGSHDFKVNVTVTWKLVKPLLKANN